MECITISTMLDGLRDFQGDGAWGHLAAHFRLPIISHAVRMGLPPCDAALRRVRGDSGGW
jgi:hypothetical protein